MRVEGGGLVAGSNETFLNRLLVTGASGNMGRVLRPLLRREGRILRLADLAEPTDPQPGEEVIAFDLTDPDAVAKACQGVEAVLHLGGISVEASFEDVLAVNIAGTNNLLRAAVDAGVSKVMLASSNHAVGFYRRGDIPPGADGLPDDIPARPDTFYGWSKAAIEPLGSLYHSRYGIDITVPSPEELAGRRTAMMGHQGHVAMLSRISPEMLAIVSSDLGTG